MATTDADPIQRAVAYAERVDRRDVPAGRWARLACRRFLDDLDDAQKPRSPWRFNQSAALAPIEFSELMVNVKGPLAGQPIELLDFQVWTLVNLFGFVDRKTGHRRFRQASIWMPRGNGKTTEAAALALCMTFTENEGGAEGYSAAVTRAQASIMFDMAKQMVMRNPGFRSFYGVQVNAHSISQMHSGSKLAAVSSDAKALDGLNVHIAVLDEIASHKSSAVYDVLITAMGKRVQPLMISISTATDNTTGKGRQVWNYTEEVLSGQLRDPGFFGVIYSADPDDDPWSETTWIKANPGWGVMVQPDHIRSLAKQALASPALQAAFKTRHLNLWVSAQRALFDMLHWQACADPELRIEDFAGKPCFVGIDMAARVDLAAVVLVFPETGEDDVTRYAVFSRAFLPQQAVDPDRNPLYVQWAEDGALTVTEGATTDFAAIQDWLREAAHTFDVRLIGYDPYMMIQFGQELTNDGFPMKEYRSSTLNFSEPTKLLDALMRDRRIRHTGDAVLGYCMGNVVGHSDARDNIYPRKEDRSKKIDCAIATIIALGVSIASEADGGGYIYTDRSLLVF